MTPKIEANIARAEALLAAGFTTKAARKDANDYLGRAFDDARSALQSDLLRDRDNEEHRKAYYDLPFQLNHWRARHADAVKAHCSPLIAAAALPIIERLVALRAQVQSAPELPKPPTKKAIRAATEVVGTCQVCARPIGFKAGVIAHHGYERPGQGWQTASCFGARALPFEQSRDRLGEWIELCKTSAADHANIAKEIRAETRPVGWSISQHNFVVTRETHEWVQGMAAAAGALTRRSIRTWEERRDAAADGEVAQARRYEREATAQKVRFDAWVATA